MANCEGCGIEISGKYKYCYDCNQKQKALTANTDIANQLSAINNNLYHLTVAMAVILEKNFNCKIVWVSATEKEKAHFEAKYE